MKTLTTGLSSSRRAIFWCRAARFYLGEEQEEYTLKKILEAATPAEEKPVSQP